MASKQKPATRAPAPEVIDQDQLALATLFGENEGTLAAKAVEAFRSFIGGLRGFVQRAQALETRAAETLEKAAELRPPATSADDEQIQSFIRTANADRKEVEEHWSICSAVHGFHRRLTAQRDKPTKALERASAIAQQLHNTYVDAEKRRAQEEEDRIRREREDQARRDRDRELLEADQKAVALEAQSADLSEREQRFVELVFLGYNSPATAARQAGYKEPEKQGERLMAAPKIKAAIAAKKEAAAIRQQSTARRAAPLEVEHTEVRPNITRSSGAVDRSTHSAEILNERLFVEAAVGGQHGIPLDCLMANPTKLNEYARSLQERINVWPGIRHKKSTKTI